MCGWGRFGVEEGWSWAGLGILGSKLWDAAAQLQPKEQF